MWIVSQLVMVPNLWLPAVERGKKNMKKMTKLHLAVHNEKTKERDAGKWLPLRALLPDKVV